MGKNEKIAAKSKVNDLEGMSYKESAANYASYILVTCFLLICLFNGLFPAFIAGVITYLMVIKFSPNLQNVGNNSGRYIGVSISHSAARLMVVGIISAVVIGAITILTWGLITFFSSENGNPKILFEKLADIIDSSRANCPEWICSHIPYGADELRVQITDWMRHHASSMKSVTESIGHSFVRIFLGMIVGAMVSLHLQFSNRGPLSCALMNRVISLSTAFEKVVFAQIKISLINTFMTGIFVFVILPLFDVNLPFAKTLVIFTFIFGLIPIVGNVITNTMMVIIALPFGLITALGCLTFLIVLHKIEYFLNAKIIGGEIQARAWELLIVMLIFESIFGLIGLVAAPIIYAYVKHELKSLRLI